MLLAWNLWLRHTNEHELHPILRGEKNNTRSSLLQGRRVPPPRFGPSSASKRSLQGVLESGKRAVPAGTRKILINRHQHSQVRLRSD
jgi:hypothetical protein